MKVLLLSSYELGRQSFGISSAAAWIRSAEADVRVQDLSLETLDRKAVREADLIAFYLPMHTATRIAVTVCERVRKINPAAHICFFGLYASVNEEMLRSIGADSLIGGEFEEDLFNLVCSLKSVEQTPTVDDSSGSTFSLSRQQFVRPDRSELPPLASYAHLNMPDGSTRVTGYTEATRGCKHLCRHCPVVPVYGGQFRIVQRHVVLDDIAQQVDAGAEHITFGDPDFFNGPGHSLKIVDEMHRRWPDLTFDATIKIEHLVKHRDKLEQLRKSGCVLITSAVEAMDEHILDVFDKRHTRQEFETVAYLCRDVGIGFNPTFVAFTPWTSMPIYRDFLTTIKRVGLVENVSPIQYAIRLLIPNGSRLLEHPETAQYIKPFDPDGLIYPWQHPDPQMDDLQETVLEIVELGNKAESTRAEVFNLVWNAAMTPDRTPHTLVGSANGRSLRDGYGHPPIPFLSEPWYC